MVFLHFKTIHKMVHGFLFTKAIEKITYLENFIKNVLDVMSIDLHLHKHLYQKETRLLLLYGVIILSNKYEFNVILITTEVRLFFQLGKFILKYIWKNKPGF
jgi:hypothetical protein